MARRERRGETTLFWFIIHVFRGFLGVLTSFSRSEGIHRSYIGHRRELLSDDYRTTRRALALPSALAPLLLHIVVKEIFGVFSRLFSKYSVLVHKIKNRIPNHTHTQTSLDRRILVRTLFSLEAFPKIFFLLPL